MTTCRIVAPITNENICTPNTFGYTNLINSQMPKYNILSRPCQPLHSPKKEISQAQIAGLYQSPVPQPQRTARLFISYIYFSNSIAFTSAAARCAAFLRPAEAVTRSPGTGCPSHTASASVSEHVCTCSSETHRQWLSDWV